MKKKIFTLLTLLVACVTGAWADEAVISWYMGEDGAAATAANSITGASGCDAEGFTIAITGNTGKNWTSGNGDITYNTKTYKTLKNSNGAQNTITCPSGKVATQVVFYVTTNADSSGKLTEFDGSSCNDEVSSLKDYEKPKIITKSLDYKNSFTFTFSTNQVCFIAVVTYTDAVTNRDITWNNGGHGTAPTSPTNAATFTLPTMDPDGGYVNTGWKADQIVKVSGADVAANTEIVVGTTVTLTANTTFTGVWKTPSTFALTSDAEVEVAIAGKSTITSENNAGTVTYASANESVATVSASGVITGVAGGKTTITVTDPGSTDVAGGSATVTVLVPYAASAADSYTLDNSQYAFSNSDNTKYYFTNGFIISNTAKKGYGYANMGTAGTGIKFSANTAYTINTPSTVTVKYAVFTARNNYGSDKAAATWGTVFGTDYSTEQLPWSNENPEEKDIVVASPSPGANLIFTPGGNQWQAIIKLYTVDYTAKVTIGSTGWATFSSAYAMDFEHATPAGLKAYMVTGASEGAITKSDAVKNVPGNTGLLLNGTASTTYTIPMLESSTTSTTGNLMTACVAKTTVNYDSNSGYNYVLVSNGGTAEFQKIVDGANGTVEIPAGKAYLALTANPGAPTLSIDFGDSNGINTLNVERETLNGEVYNLAGQRVANPTKGLYIVNGKKVIVK